MKPWRKKLKVGMDGLLGADPRIRAGGDDIGGGGGLVDRSVGSETVQRIWANACESGT